MAKTKTAPPVPPPPRPAEYTVVARRYRPQQFADLIGQEHVAQALTNALAAGRVAHAYLFTGNRGVGKTSAARILAKALNCVHGPTATPCDKCDVCTAIIAGDDVDTLEIDGASNNKVEEIRDLKSNVGFRPQRARYKIYIIDEVHMLSTSAFNALLKTLEEPPPHVKFIFATTEVQKIPITILSRCQRFDFAAIGPAKIAATLRHIVQKEGLRATDDAVAAVARRAGGSMRDAQTLLDQLLAGLGDADLTAERVHELLGTAGDDRVADLADAILANDPKRALGLVTTFADNGIQPGELVDQLIDYWRGLMLAAAGGPEYRDLPVGPNLVERVRSHATAKSLDTVLAGIDLLTSTKAKVRGSPHVQVLLEVAVLRLSRLDELLSVGQLAREMASGSIPTATNGTTRPPATTSPQPVAEAVKKNALTGSNGTHPVGENGKPAWPAVWERVLHEVGPVLRTKLQPAGIPAIIGPNALAIRFPAGYSSAYDHCSDGRSQEVLGLALKKVAGGDWSVRVELDAPAPTAVADAPPTPALDLRRELLKLPLFEKANQTLGAQLMRVDDGFNPFANPAAAVEPAPIDPDEV